MKIDTYKDGKLISTETVPDSVRSPEDLRLDALRLKAAAGAVTPSEVAELLKLLVKAGRL